jgi:hypothetical protein
MQTSPYKTHQLVLEDNADLLDQAASVLGAIDDAAYRHQVSLPGGQWIGGHVRHIVEFYECLVDGLCAGRVDYDARRRDPLIEMNRPAAIERLHALRRRLLNQARLGEDRVLWVAVEGAMESSGDRTFVLSSIGRELQAVASHTVHHFALIAALLHVSGFEVPADFGVSKATLQFRQGMKAHEAA